MKITNSNTQTWMHRPDNKNTIIITMELDRPVVLKLVPQMMMITNK